MTRCEDSIEEFASDDSDEDIYLYVRLLVFDRSSHICTSSIYSTKPSNFAIDHSYSFDMVIINRVRTLFGTKNSRTFQGHSRAQFQFFKHSIL